VPAARSYAADASIINMSRKNEPSGSMAKCAFVSVEAAIWSARIALTFSSGVCMRAIQTGKSILRRHVRQISTAKPERPSVSSHCALV
jgi:hypothetical protein